ncbi:MAG: nucleoside hydrolase [Armatimonadetes bacterium]|nr:nucleoside hydrolase [Armatimonadota bacterium]
MTEELSTPILLDTDIGSDIDDALCLAYLLCQPRCELLGVTTVTGEPDKRAMLVDMLCRIAGRNDVPIHSGSYKPLFGQQLQPQASQAVVLERYPHRQDFEPCTAVEFLRQTIRRRPGEITLLTVGPLTNIGLLFATDPEIPGMLKRLVLMCGVFSTELPDLPAREWNAMGDPHATALVYGARVSDHLSIGLDVTKRCVMDAAACRERFRGELLGAVAEMAEVWFRCADRITFHDPLAAAVIFDPEICSYQAGKVEVDTETADGAGTTVWNTDVEDKPNRIAVGVNPDRFFDHYFSVVR